MTTTDNKIVVGWLDSNIREIVRAGSLSRFTFVLITSVDSDVDLSGSEFGESLRSFDPACTFLGAGVLIPGRLAKPIEESLSLFHGFDEVWCFTERPLVSKPADVSIVAPLNFTEEGVFPELSKWMDSSRCRLGLGDGFGLNFAMSEEQFGTWLRAAIGE